MDAPIRQRWSSRDTRCPSNRNGQRTLGSWQGSGKRIPTRNLLCWSTCSFCGRESDNYDLVLLRESNVSQVPTPMVLQVLRVGTIEGPDATRGISSLEAPVRLGVARKGR